MTASPPPDDLTAAPPVTGPPVDGPRVDDALAALRVSAFRTYFAGQLCSSVGTWFQLLAIGLLVVALTGNAVALAAVPALMWLPTLLLGGYGGVITDRHDSRQVLVATNAVQGLLAAVLAAITVVGAVNQWWIYGIVLAGGVTLAVDRPATQLIPAELVPLPLVANALGLNSVVQSAARLIGPALAGVAYATLGPSWCFAINAASFGVVVVALLSLRAGELRPRPRAAREPGQARQGLRYAWGQPELRNVLLGNATIGVLAFNFFIVITGMVQFTFGAGGLATGIAHASNAIGAVAGGLLVGRVVARSERRLDLVCVAFGLALLACGAAPSLPVFVLLGPALGLTIVVYQVSVQARIHRVADPAMLGRVLGLMTLGTFGTTPIGSVIIGAVMQQWSPRAAFAVGGGSCLAVAAVLRVAVTRERAPDPG
jgi:MFS family permease